MLSTARQTMYESMKQRLTGLSQRYVTVLQRYLREGPRGNLRPALELGRRAVALRVETLDLARIHERALGILDLSSAKNGMAKRMNRAEIFFTEAIIPIVERHRAARQSKSELKQMTRTLNRRTAELALTNRQLQHGIVRRKSVEAALQISNSHYTKLLKDSLQLQARLRHLTHRVLAAQEDERKKISGELQDEIAQTLLGINVRLLSLKLEARGNTEGFKNEIARTQKLVLRSAKSVRRVASRLGGI
jgi:signal transduction histidine kinase